MNDNGKMFADFCSFNKLVIGGRAFPHKKACSLVSPESRTKNQINHICELSKFSRSLLGVRAKRGVDVASDHYFIMGRCRLMLKKYNTGPTKTSYKYNIDMLKDDETKNRFQLTISNKYQELASLQKLTKLRGRSSKTRRGRSRQGRYSITRKLEGAKKDPRKPVRAKSGEVLPEQQKQRKRWAEHLRELLNRPPPSEMPDIIPADTPLQVNENRPRKTDIKKAIRHLKNRRTAGLDGIPSGATKADFNNSTRMLHELFGKIW